MIWLCEHFILAFKDGMVGSLLAIYYYSKRTYTEQKHSGVGHGSRPVPDEGRGLAPAGLDGRLALGEHRSEEQGDNRSCCCPVGHLPLAAVGCRRSCWPGSLQGLCWELFFRGKQINFLWENLNLGRFSWRRIHSDLCLPVVAFCLGPLKVKAPPCSHGLCLREGSELWILWQWTQEARSQHLPGQGEKWWLKSSFLISQHSPTGLQAQFDLTNI